MAQALRECKVTAQTGPSRLRNVIERFVEATHTFAGDWTIDANGIDDLMLTLLREIDETMLPREFSISTDTGMAARLLISNRRLICLDIDSNPAGIGHSSPTDPEAAANLFAQQLQDVFQRSREIRVRLTGRENAAMATNISCSAQCLAESFGLRLNSRAKQNRMGEFSRHAAPFAVASLRLLSGQKNQDSHGPDHLVALLTALVQRRANKARHHDQPLQIKSAQPWCEVVQVNDSLSMVQAVEHDETVLFLVGVEKTHELTTAWQRIYRSPSPGA